MNITVAGAGAGKTTKMAKDVLEYSKMTDNKKYIFVITFTNSACNKIKEELKKRNGTIPQRIKVMTIHSFLLQQFIFPFYHLVYPQKFKSVSVINLPTNPMYKNNKIKELKKLEMIHVKEITSEAQYLICGKGNDNKKIKEKRKNIINLLSKYIDSIYIDEAQDIDEKCKFVLSELEKHNIIINLIGDPKQDLRGRNVFKKIVDEQKDANFININYRCPIEHVTFSNKYVENKQQQNSIKIGGNINFIFEDDINLNEYMSEFAFGLQYIYQKNKRFVFNDNVQDNSSLTHELKIIVNETELSNIKKETTLYFLLSETQKSIKTNNDKKLIIKAIERRLDYKLNNKQWAKLHEAMETFEKSINDYDEQGIIVQSIDKVKGLDNENCLFIISNELFPYLVGLKKENNKMNNYLYVGLTRSKENLTILITNEVVDKYGKKYVKEKIDYILDN
ncbi:AAA family ATPase [Staphylococcus haemolyticus]